MHVENQGGRRGHEIFLVIHASRNQNIQNIHNRSFKKKKKIHNRIVTTKHVNNQVRHQENKPEPLQNAIII